ncbi:hypothetical protein PGIGA_G00014010 [Pangasianodon gigas]|uniref:Uncharacterized protein n=1 Tax=Pangasianodon gigas TaxID=30993 RepID=A0ACC5WTC8_PANGG|nr:hypothetical protein [Pangasianodon gigas]
MLIINKVAAESTPRRGTEDMFALRLGLRVAAGIQTAGRSINTHAFVKSASNKHSGAERSISGVHAVHLLEQREGERERISKVSGTAVQQVAVSSPSSMVPIRS